MNGHYLTCPVLCGHIVPMDLADSRAGFRALIGHIRSHESGLVVSGAPRLDRARMFRFALTATVIDAHTARTRFEQRCDVKAEHLPHGMPAAVAGLPSRCYGAGRCRTVPPLPTTHEPSPEATP